MALRASVTVEGVEELQKILAKMPRELNELTEQAIEDAAIDAVARMKREAAVDTGNLRRNITFTKLGDDAEISSQAFNESGNDYAAHVEYGTRFTKPQPYFWHNIQAAQREVVAQLRSILKRITK